MELNSSVFALQSIKAEIKDQDCVSIEDIYKSINIMPYNKVQSDKIRIYEAFYITSNFLRRYNINVSPNNLNRPILLLAGTSIPMSDRIDLVKYIIESGYELATLCNEIGGLFDIKINPKRERVESLRDYLDYLMQTVGIDKIDIVAQSYSAFEIIRLLIDNPAKYASFVKSIILINPPGFNENAGIVKHCSRFVIHHVMKGYTKALNILTKRNFDESVKRFAKSEINGINLWTYKTIKNPTRTIREVIDIVSYRIKEPLRSLIVYYNYDINIFLQTDDQILPYKITLDQVIDILPSSNIKIVPGGHNDIFTQSWQRSALLDFIIEVRARIA